MKKYREVFTVDSTRWQPYQTKPIYGEAANRITEDINISYQMFYEVAKVGPLQGYEFETMIELIDTGLNFLLTFTRLPNGSNLARCYHNDKLVGYLAWDENVTRLFISVNIKLGE